MGRQIFHSWLPVTLAAQAQGEAVPSAVGQAERLCTAAEAQAVLAAVDVGWVYGQMSGHLEPSDCWHHAASCCQDLAAAPEAYINLVCIEPS